MPSLQRLEPLRAQKGRFEKPSQKIVFALYTVRVCVCVLSWQCARVLVIVTVPMRAGVFAYVFMMLCSEAPSGNGAGVRVSARMCFTCPTLGRLPVSCW